MRDYPSDKYASRDIVSGHIFKFRVCKRRYLPAYEVERHGIDLRKIMSHAGGVSAEFELGQRLPSVTFQRKIQRIPISLCRESSRHFKIGNRFFVLTHI